MGCFCAGVVETLARELADTQEDQPPPDRREPDEVLQPNNVIPAVHQWLSARLLPAPPWTPDPDWTDAELPDPPMPPEALGVLASLVHTHRAAKDAQLDLTSSEAASQLTRIVGTLNRRMPLFESVLEDGRPWESAALYNDQVDAVLAAASVFTPSEPDGQDEQAEQPTAPWRPLVRKVRALAPLVAVAQMAGVDLADEDAADTLADLLRTLGQVELPPLADPALVLQVLSRVDAIGRLRTSFGADPRAVPFERVVRALERKAATVADMLPPEVEVVDGQLVGMPPREANPSQLLNADTLAQAQKVVPERMQWQPPPFYQFDLLTVGAPVLALNRAMGALTPTPIRSSPCGHRCDAAALGRLTGSRGSGTGAARAR